MVLASEPVSTVQAVPAGCIHHLVGARARRTPEAVAVVFGEERLTYAELERRAGRLALRLRGRGVGPEARVGICVDRSPELVVAMLGVWKAGGACVPLDPAYPADRLAYMVADGGVRVVLTDARSAGRLPELGGEVVAVDTPHPPAPSPTRGEGEQDSADGGDALSHSRTFALSHSSFPDNLAYVIYTSGSTGRPKGVGVAHRGLCNTAGALGGLLAVRPGDRFLQFASPSFDAAVCEVAVALAAGAELHLAPRESMLPGPGLSALLEGRGITHAILPPSALALLPEAELPALLTLIVAGEACPAELVRRWAPGRRFVNAYGPTEAAICATAALCEPDGRTPPIGAAIPGASVHVLDEALEPAGEGELYVGGAGVARGYLGRPELTAERFVPDPFADGAGARLYRTGDRVRVRPDGELEFLGRLDEQVKVRGFRIEPGEVAGALAAHPRIAQAAVTAREDGAEGLRLVAYVVARGGGGLPAADELRDFLGATLPEHMIPSAFVALDALPLTPNGKTDRRALPAPPAVRPALSAPYVAPRTAAEREVAAVWEEVLGIAGIGAGDAFAELGGHSLAATQVVARFRHGLGVEVPLALVLGGGTVAEVARVVEDARAGDPSPGLPPLLPVPRGRDLPVSLPQEQVWFLTRLTPDNLSYHAHATLDFHGRLDAAALEAALAEVVRRHEIFRTTFHAADGGPVQRIHAPWPVRLPVVDFAGLPEEAREEAVQGWMRVDFRRRFDLGGLPLVRWTLLRVSGAEHRLVHVEHHLIHDGWSFGVFLRELVALYSAFARGEPSPLPEPELQFADFAVWHRELMKGERARADLAFWKAELAGADPVLELPTDRPRPPAMSFRGGAVRTRIPPAAVSAARALARRSGATLYMTLLAAFEALLHRYTGQEDFCVGGAVANRSWKEAEPLIGMIVNTVAFRTRLGRVRGFGELVAQVGATTREAYAHKDVHFGQVVEAVAPERSLSRLPIYQVAFGSHDSPYPDFDLPGVSLRVAEALSNGSAKFELGVVILPRAEQRPGAPEDEVDANWEYASDLFDRGTVERMVRHYHALLDAVLADPEASFREVPLLEEAERLQVLEWGSGEAEEDGGEAEAFLHELVAAQSLRTPEAPAVVHADRVITYAGLDARAGALAAELAARGVAPEVRVGVCLERGIDATVALLAVLRAGGVYVPLDPAYPADRLAFMLADSGARLVLADARSAGRLPDFGGEIVLVDTREHDDAADEGALSHSRTFALSHSPFPENLAYLIYTSGSTGTPKGVMVTHGAAARLLPAAVRAFGARPGSRVAQTASLSFDASILEIFIALLSGAALHVADRATVLSADALGALLREREIDVWMSSPPLLELLAGGEFPALRSVSTGGERCPGELAARWSRGRRLMNMYGPTETTIYATWHLCRPGAGGAPPIGRPEAGTRAYVLDGARQPVPAGMPGELYVGGAMLARGYLGRPELTADRFVPDPFAPVPGARMYRTGDRVRWLPDGELDFLGRVDEQVKVRGFRIEPGEVEGVLRAHPGVRAAAVAVREEAPGRRMLVAYAVADGAVTAAELREAARRRLPEYMVPGAVVLLDALPLTAGGKLDRARLPAPAPEGAREYVAPRTLSEALLAETWAGVLGVERVGAEDDFFALGGHSLLAMRVVARVREAFGVDLPVHAVFEAPTLAALAERVEALGAGAGAPPIPRAPLDRPPPLSFAQERLWFLDRLDPGKPTYNLAAALRLRGELDAAVLGAALRELALRHEPLRTVFAGSGDHAVQVVRSGAAPGLPLEDLGALPEEARERELRRRLRAHAAEPFDLERGPLFRPVLLRLHATEHVLLLRMHHAVVDGWSLDVLHRDLTALYGALARGELPALPDLPVRYADYAAWQREQLPGERLQAQLAYWRERLDGAPPVLELPADRPRPAAPGHRGAVHPLELDAGAVERLRSLGRAEGATLFMVLLAGWDALLARYADTDDVVVGTPVAGRTRAELEGLVGLFVNTLALRADLSGNPSFRELLWRVRGGTLRDLANQELPFERVVEALGPGRSRSHNPLFQVMFVLRGAPGEVPAFGPLRARPETLRADVAKFDLTLSLGEADGGLRGFVEYGTELFDRATVARMAGHFRLLLDAALRDPGLPLRSLPLMDPEEERQVLEWESGGAAEAAPACVHQLFEAQAARTPDAEALVCGGERLTYAGLDRRADQLAHHLRARGVGPEARVGVCLERGPELVVALLATLKAGGAYVPLDPAYPAERLAYMLEDAGAAVVVAQARLAEWLPAGVPRVLLDGEHDAAAGEDALSHSRTFALSHSPSPDNLAYVLYTSGSTGMPKGVMVEHGAIAVHTLAARGAYAITPRDRVLHFAAAVFDPSLEQLLPALTCGAAVVMRPEEPWSPAELRRHLAEQGVTVANLPTAYWLQAAAEWADSGPFPPHRLRLVIAGGERMPPDAAELWRRGPLGEVRLLNGYGPTEATVTATLFEVPPAGPAPSGRVPIGRALPGRRARVLDGDGRPVPAGVPGELCLGGTGVARGYLGLPAATAAAFVPDDLGGEPGARMYRTGDRARWLPDGTLEYLGRIDQQVKVRGFRIEPGEVEAALRGHALVRDAAVVVREDAGERRLVGYVVPEGGAPAPAELRGWLGERLPEYMVPGAIVVLDALPTTATGKVDRRALPAPEAGGSTEGYLAPRTPVEEVLAGIWSELLGVERVGAHDDFFGLGGHSLLATRVAARVREVLHVDLPLRALFDAPVLEGLAERVEAELRGGAPCAPPIAPAASGGSAPLSFAQERLWFLDRMDPGRPLYNFGPAVRLSGALDVGALERALDALVRRHPALRTAFPMHGDAPVQAVAPEEAFRLEVEDAALHEGEAREDGARRLAGEELRRPFDLARGPLFRARLFRLGADDHVLTLAMHHAVTDAWSMEVVFRELGEAYGAFRRGGEPGLPALPVSYADYAAWQREALRSGALDGEIAYWTGRLEGAPAALELPSDRPRPAAQSFRGGIHSHPVPPALAGALRAAGRRSGATPFMVLLAGLDVLLSRWSGQDDVVVGTPVAGRTRAEVHGVVGFFVNTLALRTDLGGDPTFRELLGAVRDGALGAYAHQDLPFDRLVEELRVPRDPGRSPVFQVMFTLQDARGGEPRLDGVECTTLPPARRHALFDLALTVRESGSGMEAVWDFAADLFDAATVERMAGCYLTLLEAAAADPDRPVSGLPLLADAERGRILLGWSRAAAGVAETRPVHELVAEQARRAPGAVALRSGDEALGYAELERRANRLARRLRGAGVGPESVVGVYLDRGIDQVVSVLAVHRAGGAYLPLDPGYPRDRLAFMLADSGARVLLTHSRRSGELAVPGAATVCLDGGEAVDAAADSTPLPGGAGPLELAYLIYTSGSTGRPKGVQVEQRSLTHTLAGNLAALGIGPGDEVHALASFAFDIWLFETLLPLAAGATVRLVPAERVPEVDRLAGELREATVLHAVPALMRPLVDRVRRGGAGPLGGMRRVFVGGDAVPPELLAEMREAFPSAEIAVLYGPTEAAIVCSRHVVTGGEGERRVLGRPLAGVSLHVLDARGHPVPAGVPGELYVGGPGVARGYHGRPGLTAERFLPDPFSTLPGARLCRTGDRARWLADGTLEFLGRTDQQVKVRGFRVEPGEIESTLAGHPGVRQAVVLALDGAGGDRRLRACIVPEGEAPGVAELRAFLRERLPDHMVPAEYVALGAFPLTPTGKVDRRALAALDAERGDAGRPSVPPRSAVETAVAGIWAEMLGVERVGVHDNFFELGGHSILLARTTARIQEAFRTELPIRRFFEAPTVAELSVLLVELEPRPGQAEKIAVLFNRIRGMSTEEVARALHGSAPARP